MTTADVPTVLSPGDTNAIGRMLGVLGDEWSLLIVQQAVMGATRYGHFINRLPISHAVLSNRLRSLLTQGLLTHADGGYLPTARSRSLWPLLLLIWEWERTWVPEHADRLPDMRHQRCGRSFSPVLRCACCRFSVGPDTVALTVGPSGSWERCAPAAATRRRSHSPSTSPSATGQAGLFSETLTVLGNRWAAALLVAAFLGGNRFNDLQSQLGAPPSLLAQRLQTFCEIGVLRRDPRADGDERGAYLLTDKGRAFFPILATAVQWAQRWFSAPEGPAIVMQHRDCRADFISELACDQCSGRISGAEVVVTSAEESETP